MTLAYVAWRAGTTYRVVVPVRQAGNEFLGSLKGLLYKYGLSFTVSLPQYGVFSVRGHKI